MEYNQNIKFVSALLKKLHITSHIISEPQEYISCDIDRGLRAKLFGESDYSKLLLNSPNEAKENTVYKFFDEYLCDYIFFKIPNTKNSYFFVGPYLKALPNEEFISKKASMLSLENAKTKHLYEYYRSLPVVEDENILLSIINTLGTFIWGDANNFNTEFVSYAIPDKRRPVYSAGIFENTEAVNLSLETIEQNYQNEKLLIEAVSKGKLNKVDIIASAVLNNGTEERLPDTLRNRKNYLIILNTLLRKSAEYGEVHPFHIHRLSSDFAQKIEKLFSVKQSIELQKEMMRKYCLLVKEHSLKKYSPLIAKVITLISYDLSAPLTLKHIAATLNVNASYLSALFKKECGTTLTDHINRKRMENAAHTLAHTNKQVQAIAEENGILDVNYFIRIFKKYYGITPTQFRANAI